MSVLDAQKSLASQVEEISSLRAQMLGEYEQMLSVRAEAMASQSQEVEKLQAEMLQMQKMYESEMADMEQTAKEKAGKFFSVFRNSTTHLRNVTRESWCVPFFLQKFCHVF